jgi:CHASE3 domain sensor protein
VTTEPEPVTTEPELIEPVDEITPAIVVELSAAITELIEISPEQVTVEQISQIVESAAFDDLSDEQLTVLAEIISDATDEVKDEFESAVNVFDDPALSGYVPKGSVISVASRRVVIAVTAVSMAMAVPAPSTTSADRRQKLR